MKILAQAKQLLFSKGFGSGHLPNKGERVLYKGVACKVSYTDPEFVVLFSERYGPDSVIITHTEIEEISPVPFILHSTH